MSEERTSLFRLQTMVLCDTVPQHMVPVYLAGQTADNEESVFGRVAHRNSLYPNCTIVIDGFGATNGYPGADAWCKSLTDKYAIRRQQISVVAPLAGPVNTYTGMQALAQHASEHEWEKLVIIAAPFQQLRAFLTLLGVLNGRAMSRPKIYNLPGVPMPWQAVVTHSQGTLVAPRSELIIHEFERIERYTALGHLATIDEGLEYLKRRDIAP